MTASVSKGRWLRMSETTLDRQISVAEDIVLQYALHKQYAHTARSNMYAHLGLPHTIQPIDYLIGEEYIVYHLCL